MVKLEAKEKLIQARIQLQKEKPFFSFLTMHLNFFEAKDEIKGQVPTIGVDIDGNCPYNPDFIDTLSEAECKGVLCHEVMHCALEHMARRNGREPNLWNTADDAVVNNILLQDGLSLPKGGVMPSNNSITIFGAKVKDLKDKSAEEVFDIVYSKVRKDVQKFNKQLKKYIQDNKDKNKGFDVHMEGKSKKGKKGKDGKCPTCNGKGTVPDNSKKDEKKKNKGKGQGNQEGDGQAKGKSNKDGDGQGESKGQGQGQGSGDGQGEGETTREKPCPTCNGTGSCQCGQGGKLSDQLGKDEGKDWKKILVDACTYAKQQGHLPAGMERIVGALLETHIDWKGLLYRYITNQIPIDYNWCKPSKKSYGTGVYMPGIEKEHIDVVVAIDTSGSISPTELQMFMSEVVSIIRSFRNVDLTVIDCDCRINQVRNYKQATITDALNIKLKGGGGTSHLPVFDWLNKNLPNAQLLIGFTDGYTSFPDKSKVRVNTLWVVAGSYRAPTDSFPFGQVIELPQPK